MPLRWRGRLWPSTGISAAALPKAMVDIYLPACLPYNLPTYVPTHMHAYTSGLHEWKIGNVCKPNSWSRQLQQPIETLV